MKKIEPDGPSMIHLPGNCLTTLDELLKWVIVVMQYNLRQKLDDAPTPLRYCIVIQIPWKFRFVLTLIPIKW